VRKERYHSDITTGWSIHPHPKSKERIQKPRRGLFSFLFFIPPLPFFFPYKILCTYVWIERYHSDMTTGWSVNSSIPIQKASSGGYKNFTIVYFVFEKKWPLCAFYPPNNQVTFYDILNLLSLYPPFIISFIISLSSFYYLFYNLFILPSPFFGLVVFSCTLYN
jgi:hypothetical protein